MIQLEIGPDSLRAPGQPQPCWCTPRPGLFPLCRVYTSAAWFTPSQNVLAHSFLPHTLLHLLNRTREKIHWEGYQVEAPLPLVGTASLCPASAVSALVSKGRFSSLLCLHLHYPRPWIPFPALSTRLTFVFQGSAPSYLLQEDFPVALRWSKTFVPLPIAKHRTNIIIIYLPVSTISSLREVPRLIYL